MKFKNVVTALRRPHIAHEYTIWTLKRAGSELPTKRIRNRVDIGGFSGFSEYFTVGDCMQDSECEFFEHFPFACGDIIDVGANLGVLSILLAKRFPQRTIYSVEPNPSTADALRANIKRNGCDNIRVSQLALSDRSASVRFKADPVDRATASISNKPSPHDILINSHTLDAFVAAHSIESIALLKVDVEGYEDLVFEGGRETLAARRVAMVYFEVCPALASRAGCDPKDAAKKLISFGYSLFKLTEAGSLAPASPQEIDNVELANWIAKASPV